MNPYYQIDEEPKKSSRAWVVVAIVAAVAVAVLALALALPQNREEPETSGVPEDMDSVLDGLLESLWGDHDDREPVEDESHAPEIEDIKLVSIREYEHYTDAILRVMEKIRRTEGETVGRRIGLFDFECDGVPELVVMEPVERTLPTMEMPVKRQELWVYDLDSGERVGTLDTREELQSLSVLVDRGEIVEWKIMLDTTVANILVLDSGLPFADGEQQCWCTVDKNYTLTEVMSESLFMTTGVTGYWSVGSQEVTQEVFVNYRQAYFRKYRREDRTKTAIETAWDTTLTDAEVVRRMFDENHEQWFVVIE